MECLTLQLNFSGLKNWEFISEIYCIFDLYHTIMLSCMIRILTNDISKKD